MTKLQAFHNDQAIKYFYLERTKAHFLADNIIQGIGWENGKGCAVGCSMECYDHSLYPEKIGMPKWIARVEDSLFEGMDKKIMKKYEFGWPHAFFEACPLGVDLEQIKAPFLIFILESTFDKFDHKQFPDVKKSIDNVIDLYKSGETNIEKFFLVGRVSWDATCAATAAKVAGTSGADWAVKAGWAGAWASGRAPIAAAWAAEYAAEVAEAEVAEYEKFADKLLELMRECK